MDLKGPSVFLKFKENIDVTEALSILREFISSNFGPLNLYIEHENFIYKFPSDFSVSDNTTILENYFYIKKKTDVGQFKLNLKL